MHIGDICYINHLKKHSYLKKPLLKITILREGKGEITLRKLLGKYAIINALAHHLKILILLK